MLKMTRPTSITIIAAIFILLGSLSAFALIYGLFHDALNINFTILMIPVGFGLLKGRSSSRGWAKFWIGLFSICSAILLLLYPFIGDSMNVSWLGEEIFGYARLFIAVGFPIIFLLSSRWMWRRLTSTDILPFFDDYHKQETSLDQSIPTNKNA